MKKLGLLLLGLVLSSSLLRGKSYEGQKCIKNRTEGPIQVWLHPVEGKVVHINWFKPGEKKCAKYKDKSPKAKEDGRGYLEEIVIAYPDPDKGKKESYKTFSREWNNDLINKTAKFRFYYNPYAVKKFKFYMTNY